MKWYQSNIAVWVFSLFLPPLGLAFAFIYRKSLIIKAFSVVMTLSFVLYVAIRKPNPSSTLPLADSAGSINSGYDTAKIRLNVNEFIQQIESIDQQVFEIEMRYNNRVSNMSVVDRTTLYNAAKECFDALTPYWLESRNIELPAVPTDAMKQASKEAKKALELSLFTRRQRCEIVMGMADEGRFNPSDMQKIQQKNKETDAWVSSLTANIIKLKDEAGL
jgi:hypothetical protein